MFVSALSITKLRAFKSEISSSILHMLTHNPNILQLWENNGSRVFCGSHLCKTNQKKKSSEDLMSCWVTNALESRRPTKQFFSRRWGYVTSECVAVVHDGSSFVKLYSSPCIRTSTIEHKTQYGFNSLAG